MVTTMNQDEADDRASISRRTEKSGSSLASRTKDPYNNQKSKILHFGNYTEPLIKLQRNSELTSSRPRTLLRTCLCQVTWMRTIRVYFADPTRRTMPMSRLPSQFWFKNKKQIGNTIECDVHKSQILFSTFSSRKSKHIYIY